MHQTINAGILGVGMALPDRIVTNADIEKLVETNDEWIVSRTGIRERRVSRPDETVSTLGLTAAQRALEDAGLQPSDIDLVLCCTTYGDYVWPATACLIQDQIGAKRAAAFDLSAACSGFVYGMTTASAMIQAGIMRHVLLVGADTLTKQIDWSDRNTCVLFGDGAGAVVLGPCGPTDGVLASALHADGSGAELIYVPGGGAKAPLTHDAIDAKLQYISMHGAEVFKFAVKIMGEVCLEALAKADLTAADVSLFIPHQANIRIIKAAADRMGLPPEKVVINVQNYGNTSAATIPIALAEAKEAGRINKGDLLVFVGFGAGLTWGANVVRWIID